MFFTLSKFMPWLALGGLPLISCRSIDPQVVLNEYLVPKTRDLLKGIVRNVTSIPYSRKLVSVRRGEYEMEMTFFDAVMGPALKLSQCPECSYCEGNTACRGRCAEALTKILVRLLWPSKGRVGGHQCSYRRANRVHIPFYYSDRCLQRPRGARDFHLKDEFIPALKGSDPAGLQEEDLRKSEPCQFIHGIDPRCAPPQLTLEDVKALGIDVEVANSRTSHSSSPTFPNNGGGRRRATPRAGRSPNFA